MLKAAIGQYGFGRVCRVGVFFVLMLIAVGFVEGRGIDEGRAARAARGFLRACGDRPLNARVGGRVLGVERFNDENGEALYYVVKLEPSGFVIVAGDDLAGPVVAFSEGGEYDASESNPLGALVSGDMRGRIAEAREMQREMDSRRGKAEGDRSRRGVRARDKWEELEGYADGGESGAAFDGAGSVSDVRVAGLVGSKWGQDEVAGVPLYNYYTPNNYPTGCVATAMAQLMRYHEYPTVGVGNNQWFTITVNGISQSAKLRGGNGYGSAYNWAMMPTVPSGVLTSSQRQAIGGLCYDAGVSVEMSYRSDNSSSYMNDADEQLEDTFRYSNSIFGYNNNAQIGPGLTEMINPNLDAGHVVLLGIDGPQGGHAVVCDGYGYSFSTLYHHLNMGWGGSHDAWYDLPVIDSAYYFDVIDSCIYNVFTGGSGEIISGRVVDMASNPLAGVTVRAVSGSYNYSSTTNANGIYAIKGAASNKNYTVSASKAGHAFVSKNAVTGRSEDWERQCGNVWGVNFVSSSATPPNAYDGSVTVFSGVGESITLEAGDEGYPDPPGALKYFVVSLPEFGVLVEPGVGEITSVPYELGAWGNVVEYTSCSYFTGEDGFEFVADDGGAAPTGGWSDEATVTVEVNNQINTTTSDEEYWIIDWPLDASSHDGRTQVIYLQSEIGQAQSITDLALNLYQSAGQVLNNWTIRMKHTNQSYYSGFPQLETSGWTTVYSGSMSAAPVGWRNFSFQRPFEYNGVSNVLIDFSFDNSSSSSAGVCFGDDTGATRVVMAFSDSGHGSPLDWTSNTNGIYTAMAVPNIKLIGEVGGDAKVGDFQMDCRVDFKDFAILASAWLSNSGGGGWDSRCDISVPSDGQVNLADLRVWCANYLE